MAPGIDDPNRIGDGFTDLSGGVDIGRLANLIDGNQCAEAENVTFRGGAPTQRPPFIRVTQFYDNPNQAYDDHGNATGDVTSESVTVFTTGLFQGAKYFGIGPGKEYIMSMIDGRLYRIRPRKGKKEADRFEVPLERRNSSVIPIDYMVQAGGYFIVQDGQSAPIIFDGVTARRANQDMNEIFAGLMMAVGQGRIVLVGVDGQVYFGDLRDSTGRGDYDMLTFTETLFLNEGFPSALPPDCGFPRAIAFLPQQDSATGVGDCIVFGQTGAEGFTLSIPRDQWKNSQFQRPVLRKIGCSGHLAVTEANNDIFFRSPQDGWRSYRQARAEVDKWGQIPLSTNVRKWVDADTKALLKFCSAITFDNRVIMTSTPYPNQARPYHNGLLALDFDVLSTFGNASKPAWEGHWGNPEIIPEGGLKILQVVEGTFDDEQRAFAFAIDPAGHNYLLEIDKTLLGGDNNGSPQTITSRVRTRSLEFQSPMNEKKLYGGDLWVDNVTEHTVVTARFRPDQVPEFSDWDSFEVDPIDGIVEGDAAVTQPGYDPRHSLQKPGEEADETGTGRLLSRGFEFQAELQWNGRATIRKFRAQAQVLPERSGPNK